MESINLSNYEAFLLDYFEGNLNAAYTAELKRFAALNPELGIDFDGMELPKIQPSELAFDLKISLKKEHQDFEHEKVISFLEGLLGEIEAEDFENELKSNLELQKLLFKYKQTYLSSELANSKLNKNLFYIQDFFTNQKRIFDYMEGNLTEEEKINFEDKLLENTALQKELKAYLATRLIPVNESTDKNLLYKTEDDLIILNNSLLVLEGNRNEQSLTREEKDELVLFQKTLSKPDLNVTYPYKNELKKQTTKVFSLFGSTRHWSAAATFVFTLSLLFLFLKDSENEGRVPAKMLLKNQINVGSSFSNLKSKHGTNIASTKPKHKNEMLVQVIKINRNNLIKKKDTTSNNSNNQLAVANQTTQSTINSYSATNLSIENNNSIKQNQPEEKTEAILVLNQERDNDFESEDIKVPARNERKSKFWSKAVKLANNLNGLGLKALKAKDLNNEYSIAYNSFGIAKK